MELTYPKTITFLGERYVGSPHIGKWRYEQAQGSRSVVLWQDNDGLGPVARATFYMRGHNFLQKRDQSITNPSPGIRDTRTFRAAIKMLEKAVRAARDELVQLV